MSAIDTSQNQYSADVCGKTGIERHDKGLLAIDRVRVEKYVHFDLSASNHYVESIGDNVIKNAGVEID